MLYLPIAYAKSTFLYGTNVTNPIAETYKHVNTNLLMTNPTSETFLQLLIVQGKNITKRQPTIINPKKGGIQKFQGGHNLKLIMLKLFDATSFFACISLCRASLPTCAFCYISPFNTLIFFIVEYLGLR